MITDLQFLELDTLLCEKSGRDDLIGRAAYLPRNKKHPAYDRYRRALYTAQKIMDVLVRASDAEMHEFYGVLKHNQSNKKISELGLQLPYHPEDRARYYFNLAMADLQIFEARRAMDGYFIKRNPVKPAEMKTFFRSLISASAKINADADYEHAQIQPDPSVFMPETPPSAFSVAWEHGYTRPVVITVWNTLARVASPFRRKALVP